MIYYRLNEINYIFTKLNLFTKISKFSCLSVTSHFFSRPEPRGQAWAGMAVRELKNGLVSAARETGADPMVCGATRMEIGWW
jgi:hypothetical protein